MFSGPMNSRNSNSERMTTVAPNRWNGLRSWLGNTSEWRDSLLMYGCIGAAVGVLVLHPVTQAVFWFEFSDSMGSPGLLDWLTERMRTSPFHELIPMSLVFAGLGGAVGVGFGWVQRALHREKRFTRVYETLMSENLSQLIESGESEHLEFKASMRWDYENGKSNRALEEVVAKTVAGFMNHEGGLLLVGVEDDGRICGLERDYATLRTPGKDSWERCLVGVITTRLGGEWVSNLHTRFYGHADQEVAALFIEPSRRAVYVKDGRISRYFVRTGNATRELDAREAAAHSARRGT